MKGQAFSLLVKKLTFHVGVPGFEFQLCSQFQLSANVDLCRQQVVVQVISWVPASAWPKLKCRRLGSEPPDESSFCFSDILCLSASQINF